MARTTSVYVHWWNADERRQKKYHLNASQLRRLAELLDYFESLKTVKVEDS